VKMRAIYFFIFVWIFKPITIKGVTVFFPVDNYQCLHELVPYGVGNYYIDIVINTLGLVALTSAVLA
jgi:hypothetical protein